MDMVTKHCASNFTMYIHIKSLCCIPKLNSSLYVYYIWRKLGKKASWVISEISLCFPSCLGCRCNGWSSKTILLLWGKLEGRHQWQRMETYFLQKKTRYYHVYAIILRGIFYCQFIIVFGEHTRHIFNDITQ